MTTNLGALDPTAATSRDAAFATFAAIIDAGTFGPPKVIPCAVPFSPLTGVELYDRLDEADRRVGSAVRFGLDEYDDFPAKVAEARLYADALMARRA